MTPSTAAALLDLEHYPLHEPSGPAWAAVVAHHRAEMVEHGVSVLPGFVRPEAVEAMVAEAEALAPHGNHQDVHGTPYLELPDPAFAADHPRRAQVRSTLTALAYDLFPVTSPLRTLFEWDPLAGFVAAVLDRAPLYRYADPLGALNVASMAEGDELGWHFDQTDFVVSIALRPSDGGGDFEAAEHLRQPHDECYVDVAAVLAGERPERVRRLPMEAGTLMLFEGRQSLHRVTPVEGPRPRLVALLGYDTKPDTVSSDLLKLVRYGRTEALPCSPLDRSDVPA